MTAYPRPAEASEFERLPPHAIEAEMCALASMMLDKEVAGSVLSLCERDFFYLEEHRQLYDTLKMLYLEQKPVDAVILREELKKAGKLEEIGGTAYIAQVLGSVPSAAHGMHYATIVREKAVRRLIISTGNELIDKAFTSGDNTDNLLDLASRRIFDLAEKRITNPMMALGKVAEDVYNQIESQHKRGLPTGFVDLDEMLNGLQDGEMVIVAARPSMGKTAIAMNIVENLADQGFPVGVFSLEMSTQQLAQRLMCSRSGVDQQKVRTGRLSNEEYMRLARAVHELRKMPVFVDDSPGCTLLDLKTKSRRMVHEHKVRCIMIDYLQLMENPGPESRQQQITEISRGVKAVARELKVPVICLSQLNRGSENREGHKPRMSDLRESGSIEQDADVVALLHREDYYHKGDANYVDTNIAEVIIAKQRNGPTGTVELIFDGGTTRFKNKAEGYEY